MNWLLSMLLKTLIIVAMVLGTVVAWEVIERSGVLLPVPYKNVKVVHREMLPDGRLFLVISYEKTACEIRAFRVVGGSLGLIEELPWVTREGYTGVRDLEPGPQTARLTIDTQPTETSGNTWMEIRTSHDCDGISVDRVFLHLELDQREAGFGGPRSIATE